MANDVQIRGGDGGAPQAYEVPNATEIVPKAVNATFDGSGAGGSFVPTLEIISDGGVVVARVPTTTTVAAGGSAEVSWFPSGKPCPEGGLCPGFPGTDVCGGIANFGAFATGTGGGATTDLFVSRTVNCSSIIVVVGCSLAQDGFDGAIIFGCTDTKGNRYNPALCSIEAQLAGPSGALEVSMAITSFAAGGLVAGNTITVEWDPGVPVVDSACMAFAITNTSLAYTDTGFDPPGSTGITFPGTTGTTDTSLLWANCPGIGEPAAGFGGFVGGVLCAIGARPNVGTAFQQATLLDTLGSGSVALGVGLIQSLQPGELYEPGGSTGAADVSVATYTELTA